MHGIRVNGFPLKFPARFDLNAHIWKESLVGNLTHFIGSGGRVGETLSSSTSNLASFCANFTKKLFD